MLFQRPQNGENQGVIVLVASRDISDVCTEKMLLAVEIIEKDGLLVGEIPIKGRASDACFFDDFRNGDVFEVHFFHELEKRQGDIMLRIFGRFHFLHDTKSFLLSHGAVQTDRFCLKSVLLS